MKPLRADVAHKRHFPSVHYQMCLEIPFLVEPLIAQRARVWFLRVVCRLVGFQVAFVFELLAADFTVKGFLIIVDASVPLQVVDHLEWAITHLYNMDFVTAV